MTSGFSRINDQIPRDIDNRNTFKQLLAVENCTKVYHAFCMFLFSSEINYDSKVFAFELKRRLHVIDTTDVLYCCVQRNLIP